MAELDRMLNSVSENKITSGKQELNNVPKESRYHHDTTDYVLPQESPDEHKRPTTPSTKQPIRPAQPDKQVKQVAKKPVNQVTDTSSRTDSINKFILKAVQTELSKLKLDGVIKDALKIPKLKENLIGVGTSRTKQKQDKNVHLGVARKPGDKQSYLGSHREDHTDDTMVSSYHANVEASRKPHHGYLGLLKGYQGLDSKTQGHPAIHATAIPTNAVVLIQDERGSHSYHPQSSNIEGLGNRLLDSNHQEGEDEVNIRQGGETLKASDQENFAERLRKVDELLKIPHFEDVVDKTTAKPDDQVTNSPDEYDSKITEPSHEYTITMAPTSEGGTYDHEGNQRISGEPENRQSYSPSLVDEIKELGLHEYFIKDGFQSPRVPKQKKVNNAQVRRDNTDLYYNDVKRGFTMLHEV